MSYMYSEFVGFAWGVKRKPILCYGVFAFCPTHEIERGESKTGFWFH